MEPSPIPSAPPSFIARYGAKLVISLVLGGGVTWLLSHGGLPLVPPRESFAAFRGWTIPAYVASLAAVHWVRASRLRHLLRPLGEIPTRTVVATSWIAFAAALVAPLRAGEAVRPILLARRGPVRVWEATGVVGAERVLDGLGLSAVLFLSLQLTPARSPLPDRVADLPVHPSAIPAAAYTVLCAFLAAFVAMAAFFWRRAWMVRLTRLTVGLVSRRLADGAAALVGRLAEGLRFLPRARHLGPFVAETALYWCGSAAGIWLLGWGAGLEGFTLGQAFVTMGCICIGVLVPAGPGFFGTFQLSTYMALALFLPEEAVVGRGAAFVFVLYAAQVGWHLTASAVALLIDPLALAAPAENLAQDPGAR